MKLHNDEIERQANNLLNNTLSELFRSHNFKIIDNESGKREVGIDFYYQVVNRENNSDEFSFINQNKGINKKVVASRNSNFISYPLKTLRHPKSWYYKNAEPFVFTLCDIITNKIYFYFIQNDESIPKRIIEQEKNGVANFQIYIPEENILNTQNFPRFLGELHKAKINQVEKIHPNLFEPHKADYSRIKENTDKLKIIDKLIYIIDSFECIKVIPQNILSEILYHVFGDTYLSEMYITTQNENLYNTIRNIKVNRRTKKYSLEGYATENHEENLEKVISFFRVNAIHHIFFKGKRLEDGNRFCIHDLFTSRICKCERCTLERFDFKNTEKLLLKTNENYSHYENLRKAYAAFLFGDVEKAAQIFLDIYVNINKTKHPITFLTAKLNLIELKQLGESSYYFDEDLNKKLENVDEKTDDNFVLENAQHFLDIYKTLKDFRFVYRNIVKVDNLLFDLQKTLQRDRNGGWTSQHGRNEFESSFMRISNFFEYNFILLNQYQEYEILCRKILEGHIILHSLKNPDYDKFKLNFNILKMWISFVKYEDAEFLLRNYNVANLNIHNVDFVFERLDEMLQKLTNSADIVYRKKENFRLIQKISNTLQNILLIISKIDFQVVQLNHLFGKVLSFSANNKIHRLFLSSEIMKIIYAKGEFISKENLLKLIKISITKEMRLPDSSLVSKHYFEKATQQEIMEYIKLVSQSENIGEFDFKKNEKYYQYWYGFDFLDDIFKNDVATKVLEELNKKFKPELYTTAVVLDTIDYDEELFAKFLQTIPNMSEHEDRDLFGSENNHRLGQAINIAYKFNLPFDKLRKYVSYSVSTKQEYYTWLMNLDTFDYSKFNPYWLIGHNLKYYVEAFKKCEPLISHLKKSLENNYDSEVGRFYFENLV